MHRREFRELWIARMEDPNRWTCGTLYEFNRRCAVGHLLDLGGLPLDRLHTHDEKERTHQLVHDVGLAPGLPGPACLEVCTGPVGVNPLSKVAHKNDSLGRLEAIAYIRSQPILSPEIPVVTQAPVQLPALEVEEQSCA